MSLAARIILAILVLLLFIKRGDICASFGKIAHGKGNDEKCLKWFERGAKIGDMTFTNKFLHAYFVLRSGDVERARKMFTLLSMDKLDTPKKMRIKSNLALCDWKTGNIDDAIEKYEEVISLTPSTTDYGSLGYLYILKNDYKKALEFNLEAYDYNSDDSIIIDNLANTYLKLKDYDNAEKYYKKLFEKSPSFPECYFEYGKYLAEKNDETAVEYFKKALNCTFTPFSAIQRHDVIEYMEIHNINVN